MTRWLVKLQELGKSTFVLNSGERKAVYLVLVLALLGLSVKCWHAYQVRRSVGTTESIAPHPATPQNYHR